MKLMLQLFSVMALAFALTACSGGGGGGGSGEDPNPNGAYAAVSNAPGYIGEGQWSGHLYVPPSLMPHYQQFLGQNGLGYSSGSDFKLSISTSSSRGRLPGQMVFEITPAGGQPFRQYAWTSMSAAGARAFVMRYTGNSYEPLYGPKYGMPSQNPNLAMIQITAQFVDAPNHYGSPYSIAGGRILNVQVAYLGSQFATGQIFSDSDDIGGSNLFGPGSSLPDAYVAPATGYYSGSFYRARRIFTRGP